MFWVLVCQFDYFGELRVLLSVSLGVVSIVLCDDFETSWLTVPHSLLCVVLGVIVAIDSLV